MKTVSKNYQAQLLRVETATLRSFCRSNQTFVTGLMLTLLDLEDYLTIAKMSISPSDYSAEDLELFRIDYQAVSMLKKSQCLPLQVDKRVKALETFHEAERLCDETNFRLLSWANNPKDNPEMIDLVSKTQMIIRQILGPLDKDALDYAHSQCRFGPGSTGTVKRRPTSGRKFDNPRPSASPRLAELMKDCMPALWADRLVKVECVSYIGITTVAKTALTDRTIGIEPDLNIFVQLGIGALIRNRLCQFGVNLAKQSDRNRRLAGLAISYDLATIDLSSASDTVSRACVELLLPEEWRHLLWLARSDYYELDGKLFPFSKWSSMGNGYTFELETLIFTALARACGDRFGVSFGDDIIVSKKVAPLLVETLKFLGFKVNSEKSFLQGDFYESCGTDWFLGVNVRPFFFKGKKDADIKTNGQFLASVFAYANSISATAHRSSHGLSRDARYFSSWRSCLQAVPPADRLRIPAGFNTSGGFECDWDERCSDTLSASRFRYLAYVPERGWDAGDWGAYLSWHHGASRRTRSLKFESQLSANRRASLNRFVRDLAEHELSDTCYSNDGETYRYEGSHKPQFGSCFSWPNRGPWI